MQVVGALHILVVGYCLVVVCKMVSLDIQIRHSTKVNTEFLLQN